MIFTLNLPAPVGDQVSYMHENRVQRSEVTCIKIFITQYEPLIKVLYVVKNPTARCSEPIELYSHQVFATKQELLESL